MPEHLSRGGPWLSSTSNWQDQGNWLTVIHTVELTSSRHWDALSVCLWQSAGRGGGGGGGEKELTVVDMERVFIVSLLPHGIEKVHRTTVRCLQASWLLWFLHFTKCFTFQSWFQYWQQFNQNQSNHFGLPQNSQATQWTNQNSKQIYLTAGNTGKRSASDWSQPRLVLVWP